MKRAILVIALVLGLLLGSASTTLARAAERSVVTPWIELQLTAIASNRLSPPRAARSLAHVSRAMYLAALGPERGRDDAVAGAASTVLRYFFPAQAAPIDDLAGNLANRTSLAFRRGQLVGRGLIARAERDGADAVWTGTPPQGPGSWVPTPPAYLPPLEPLAGTWRTWNLNTGSRFRPAPPPPYGSARFIADVNEVYAVSQTLTDEQKRIAEYWADGPGTATPPGHWNRIAVDLVRTAGWSTLRTTSLFAALNTGQADAFIACWDTKYTYWSPRPVTAIRQLIDPSWLSFIATPPFPSYVSGHATTSGAASTILSAYFPASAGELASAAEEAAMSRLYGGIHYRNDNEVGLDLGRWVGKVAVAAYPAPAQ